jgi:hypothetical protein
MLFRDGTTGRGVSETAETGDIGLSDHSLINASL